MATAEPMLVAVIGLLVLVIVGLIAMAFLVRRRSRGVDDTTDQMRAIAGAAAGRSLAAASARRARRWCAVVAVAGSRSRRRPRWCARRAAPSFTA